MSDADLHTELDANSNSIAVIMKHISGNLRSRFRDFLTADGEKPDRHRDTEFEMPIARRARSCCSGGKSAWAIVFGSIEALTPEDLGRTITIRGEGYLVIEALNRSVAHTASHVGQIVYLARHFAGDGWTSLTIPKGASALHVKGDVQEGLAAAVRAQLTIKRLGLARLGAVLRADRERRVVHRHAGVLALVVQAVEVQAEVRLLPSASAAASRSCSSRCASAP